MKIAHYYFSYLSPHIFLLDCRCEFGDLTGRYGTVTGMMSIEATHLNFHRILGRSVVIHDHEGGRIACGTIEPDFGEDS